MRRSRRRVISTSRAGHQLLAFRFAGARARQDARAGDGRERHAHLQLWIIAAAGSLKTFGPAPVEDVFALRMRFHVAGHHRGDRRAARIRSAFSVRTACRGVQPVRPETVPELSSASRKSHDEERVVGSSFRAIRSVRPADSILNRAVGLRRAFPARIRQGIPSASLDLGHAGQQCD